MRTVAIVVSVSDSSKSLKVKSRRCSDWADGTVATFKHTRVLGSGRGHSESNSTVSEGGSPAMHHTVPGTGLGRSAETTSKINSSLVS